jgi:hypothetical protein
VFKRHRHLRLEHVAPGKRRFCLGRMPAGQGQVSPAARQRQGGRGQPGAGNRVLEFAERDPGVVKSSQADQRVGLDGPPVENAGAAPDTQEPGGAHRLGRG